MKCERCAKAEASVKITRVHDGIPSQVLLCQSCAAESSPYQKQALEKNASLDHLLKELLASQQKGHVATGEGAQKHVEEGLSCPSCGIDYTLYRATGMLGCPDCYDAFTDELEADLMRLQRATRHVGGDESPAIRGAEIQRRLVAMREELHQAIEDEDFTRAAYLRDEIAQTEKELLSAHDPANAASGEPTP